MKQDEPFWDPNMFIFSFQSHGRCETPKRFTVKEDKRKKKFVKFFMNDLDGWFVDFWVYGEGGFQLGNERSLTWCSSLSKSFEGIEDNTLTGNNYKNFTCTRIVAIYLE